MTDIQTTILSSVLTVGLTVLATWLGFQASQKLEYTKSLRRALLDVADARHRFVTNVMRLAKAKGADRDLMLDNVQDAHDELRLRVQTQCQLDEADCLADAARRFKTQVLDPARRGTLTGNQLARQARVTADEFNAAYAQAAAKVGLSPGFPGPSKASRDAEGASSSPS
jgi:hypothetical protein